jgi:hypothetical protein
LIKVRNLAPVLVNELPDIRLGFPLNRHAVRQRLSAMTGVRCRVSGTWAAAAGGQGVTLWLNERQIMPPAAGSTAVWTYQERQGENHWDRTKAARSTDIDIHSNSRKRINHHDFSEE